MIRLNIAEHAHDTTDRKLLEQQTQETLKMRNDFVSFVTHQLRTPLSGIKWMLELAKDTDDAEEKASYVEDARESADRLMSRGAGKRIALISHIEALVVVAMVFVAVALARGFGLARG